MDIPEWICKRFLEKKPFDGDITDDYDYPTDEFLKWVSTYDIGIYEMFIRLPVYLNYISSRNRPTRSSKQLRK